MDIEDEKFEQYFGRPRNFKKFADGPQNAQGSYALTPIVVGNGAQVNDIDNPELMYMQTNDNFYKKAEGMSGPA